MEPVFPVRWEKFPQGWFRIKVFLTLKEFQSKLSCLESTLNNALDTNILASLSVLLKVP
jgi:hypothetical protein